MGFPNSFVFGGLLQRQPELQAHGQSGFPPPAFDQSATFRLFPTTYNRRIVLRLARFMPDTLQRYPKRYRPRISSVPPILQPRFIPHLSKAWSHSNAREMLMQPRLFAISGHRLAFRLSQPASMRVPRPSSAWAGGHDLYGRSRKRPRSRETAIFGQNSASFHPKKKRSIFAPTAQTRHPTPDALHPTPYTPHPTPHTQAAPAALHQPRFE